MSAVLDSMSEETETPVVVGENSKRKRALVAVIDALEGFEREDVSSILDMVHRFFGLDGGTRVRAASAPLPISSAPSPSAANADYSADRSPSIREFLLEKRPQTDVERAVCLAFYLEHYRQTPHFKTTDISQMNAEAAQPKFTNTAHTLKAARRTGYVLAVSKDKQQVSAAGERFVTHLPDRVAAREAFVDLTSRLRGKKPGSGK